MELMSNLMLAFSWFGLVRNLMIGLFLITCLLLMAVVLLQKGRGGGISSAFGGALGSSPFGTKTGDVFTWITVVLAGVFLLASLVLNVLVVPEKAETGYVAPPANAATTPPADQPGMTGQPGLNTPGDATGTAGRPGAEVVIPIPPATTQSQPAD